MADKETFKVTEKSAKYRTEIQQVSMLVIETRSSRRKCKFYDDHKTK